MSELMLLVATWNCWMSYKTDMQDCCSFTCFSFEPLDQCQNVASSILSYKYYFGRCSFQLGQAVPLYSQGRSDHYSVTILRCYNDVYVNSFFTYTARPWNSLPIEWFPLTYDLNGFRINRHILTAGFF